MKNHFFKIVILNLFAYLLYVALGYVAFKFAGPPNYLVNIWPGYGVALGMVLVWGRALLPGILLASISTSGYNAIVNVGVPMGLRVSALCTVIAVGLILQILLARYLIKNYVSFDNKLKSPKSIILFFIVIGPLACLVSSTWTNVFFVLVGYVTKADDFLLRWLSWWESDAMGGLIFTPLILILFAKPRSAWRNRLVQIFIPSVALFIILMYVCSLVNRSEVSQMNNEFKKELDSRIQAFKVWFDSTKDIAKALSAYIAASNTINEQNFELFGANLLKSNPYIQAIEWVPQVKNLNAFTKKHKMTFWNYPSLKFENKNKFYYPVLYTYPRKHNSEFVGYNMSSDYRLLPTLLNSMKKSNLSLPVQLMQYEDKQIGALIFSPVYRQKQFVGFALVILKFTNAFRAIFNDMSNYSLFNIISVIDGRYMPIYNYKYNAKVPHKKSYQLHYQREISIWHGSQKLIFSGVSSDAFMNSVFSWRIFVSNFLALLFCVLLEVILFILYGQKYIVEEKVAEQTSRLQSEKAKNLLLLNSADEGILGLNQKGNVTFINPAGLTMLGYCEDEIVGSSFLKLFPAPKHIEASRLGCPIQSSITKGELRQVKESVFRCNYGCELWVDYTSIPIKMQDEITGAVVIFNDISKQRAAHSHLQKIASTDLLTGLPNRYSFQEYINGALEHAKKHRTIIAVCFLDLDNFKAVNDSLGHAAGDQLLMAMTKMLNANLRDCDYLARLSGDEFGLILKDIQTQSDVNQLITRYMDLFKMPFQLGQNHIDTSMSVGVALYPYAGTTPDVLIKNADIAMYQAKRLGKNTYVIFSPKVDVKVKRQHQIKSLLKKAIKDEKLFLSYQPQICATTASLYGLEVLVRWHDHRLNTVLPSEFASIAQESKLIVDIGRWVLTQTVKEYYKIAKNQAGLRISINISAREFENPFFEKFVREVLKGRHLDPANITFELTETVMIRYPDRVFEVMTSLARLGISFALNDFSIGHSSMSYIKTLPIKYIKINQSFVRDLGGKAENTAIIKAIIHLSKALQIKTIAEGIETHESAQWLAELGCDYLQGCFFSKPLLIEDLLATYCQANVATAIDA